MLPRLIALALFGLLGCGDGASSNAPHDAHSSTQDASDAPSTDSYDASLDAPDFERCVPACDDVTCGNDGCGGNCGVCGAEESCDDGRCLPVCLPHSDTVCVNSNVMWVDGCGELEELLETCSAGTECVEGTCIPCVPNDSLGCVDGAIHWMDSCGTPGALKTECGLDELCVEGQCVAGNSPLSGTYALTITPETAEVPEDAGSLTISLATSPVEIAIDGAGSAVWTLAVNGVDALFLGALSQGQITAAGEFTQSIEGTDVLRKAWIQALFLDDESFAGTWTEMVFVGSDESAPTQVIWELTGGLLP